MCGCCSQSQVCDRKECGIFAFLVVAPPSILIWHGTCMCATFEWNETVEQCRFKDKRWLSWMLSALEFTDENPFYYFEYIVSKGMLVVWHFLLYISFVFIFYSLLLLLKQRWVDSKANKTLAFRNFRNATQNEKRETKRMRTHKMKNGTFYLIVSPKRIHTRQTICS